MEFRVLGTLEVRADGVLVDAGPPRQRSVLAALAVDVGRPVRVETIIDRVWGEAPPNRVRDLLYVYISRIRKMIDEARADGRAPARLIRRSGGYVLDVEPDCVDAHRFRSLLDEAADPRCPDSQRVALLREALGLWRSTPLADLPGPWAGQVRQGWEQLRLDAVGAWAQTELRLGNSSAVVGPLTDMIAEHPLVESLVAVLMRALHVSGRSADALDCYTTTRQRLAEELGIDPAPELQRLQQTILRGDLDSGAPPPSISFSALVIPAQLPLEMTGFTGRGDELAQLNKILAETGEQPTAVVISAVSGTAGVGKSTLAVHYAHRVVDRFPDGQLYVNLRGFDPTGSAMSPAEAVRTFLDAFCVPAPRIPVSPEAQVGLYRSILAGRRVLIVLDNARDAEQVRPLLPGSPGCLVVVTSRNQLTSLVVAEGAHPLTLDLLSNTEARQLLVRRVGEDRAAAEPAAVDEIITRCVGLPLALAIVAARAATHPRFSLEALADELREARGGLDAFGGGEAVADVRAVFSWSYHALSSEAAGLFRLLGLHPGPDVATPAVASLAGVSVAQIRLLLAELAQAHLITEHIPGRYTFHDLLRAYATELAHTTDTNGERNAATRRMLDHYLHTACTAQALLDPHLDRVSPTASQPKMIAEGLTDHEQALAWFTVEHPVLLAVTRRAARTDAFATHAWQLAWTMATFLDRRGHWHDWAATMRTGLNAARKIGDQAGEARAHRGLAAAYGRMGRFADAHTHLRQALGLYVNLADHTGEALTRLNVGWTFDRERRHEEALTHAQLALKSLRAADHPSLHAKALNAVGYDHACIGNHLQAITYCQQAITLQQRTGDRRGEAQTWDSLGNAHLQAGHHFEAARCYQRALALFRDIGDRFNEADVLARLGDTQHAHGELEAASSFWRDALGILDELGHTDADQIRAKLHDLNRIAGP
jgi:DNA-binding SARP family transcriptional activator/tetratricopeptide (TPR) repeat protein